MRIFLIVFLYINISVSGMVLAADTHVDPHWTYHEQYKWNLLIDRLYSPPYPYAECGIGQKQSPINIDSNDLDFTNDLDEIKIEYGKVPISLTNNGHTVRVNISQGLLYIGKYKYQLVQVHFHSPSEHTINGKHYPIEAHFINGIDDGGLAVVGVFYEIGMFNPEFDKILKEAPKAKNMTITKDDFIDLNKLLPHNTEDFYTYFGSLTTPPCSEGIQWLLLKQTVPISIEQIEEFKTKYYQNNVRKEQKLNGRKVDTR